MNYYLSVLKNYAVFSGRARRSEFWYFVLFNLIFSIISGILDSIVGIKVTPYHLGLINLIYALAVFIPGIAVTARRLQDTGKSGWMMLIVFIPIVGAIWLLILMCLDSNSGDNEYGPNPKNIIPTISPEPIQPASPSQPLVS